MAVGGFRLFKASARAVANSWYSTSSEMSAGFEKAGNQAQLELLMARLLNVGIAVCEILTFAMSELRFHVQLILHWLLLSGLMSISIHMILRRASVQKNQVYCWGILSLKPASSIGNTYFHPDTSFIAILRSNS